MMEPSLYEVVVTYHDPFGIWDEVEDSMKSILPLPVNVDKINVSHWNKNIQLPYGVNSEFCEGGSFRCRYVKADDVSRSEPPQRDMFSNDVPYLHIYLLPPMDYVFFKRNAKVPLKSFLSAQKYKGVVVIYGLCNKDNTEQQKSNCKTIDKIRRIFASVSLSQSRLCLVPMIEMPLLNVNTTSSVDAKGTRNIETLSCKNWESLAIAMGDAISETVAMRLIDIAGVIHRTKSQSPNTLIMLYESILRMHLKCGQPLDAVDGYITLIREIELLVQRSIQPQDLERPPFIFYTNSVYTMQNENSYFEVYQYLCCVSIQLLGGMNSVSNLCRTCHIFVDYCMLTVLFISRNLCLNYVVWSLALITEAVSYIHAKTNELSDLSHLFELVNVTETKDQHKTTNVSTIARICATFKGKKDGRCYNTARKDHGDDSFASSNTMEFIVHDKKPLPSNIVAHDSPIECLHHNNGYKCIRRCIGMLYTFMYKLLKNIDNVLLCDPLDATEDLKRDISYKRYLELGLQIWGRLKSNDSRIHMLSDIIQNSALNFSHGDLPRFSNVMDSLNKNDFAISFLKKDSSIMGWSLCGFIDKKCQVFLWFGPHEPNTFLKEPLERVKAVISADLNGFYNHPDTCLSPCHIEDEAVNIYLRILGEAKIDIGNVTVPFQAYGQFVKSRTSTYAFTLNLYSSEELLCANICVRLREEQEQFVEIPTNRLHEYEEVRLDGVHISRGLNLFKVEHCFTKLCNYTLDSFIIDTNQLRIVQNAHAPIPLGLLSGVVNASKSFRVEPQYLLSTIMLPTTFIQRVSNDDINIKVLPCSDAFACSNLVLLAGVRNFITFQLCGLKGGQFCLLTSGIRYDIEYSSLLSNGTKTSFLGKQETSDGMEMIIPSSKSSNHLICISAQLDPNTRQDRIHQVVRICCGDVREFSFEFIVIPPFCREVSSTENGLLQVILEPTAPYYTQIDSVLVNGHLFVKGPTLLERGSRFCLSIDNIAMATLNSDDTSRFQCFNGHTSNDCYVEESLDINKDADQMPSVGPTGAEIHEVEDGRQTVTPFTRGLSQSAMLPIPTLTENDITVNYRVLRRKCPHHQITPNMGLEVLSGPLDYRFVVPHGRVNDVVVEYKTPPFCFFNVSFDVTIVIHTNREISYEYEIETDHRWFVEGPVRGKNQILHALETLPLRFKMTALECAGGNLLQLPSIRFGGLRAPVVHKEIFLLNTLNT